MEDKEIPEELKEIWNIISNMKFDIIELKFALSWIEDHPDRIDDVEEFSHGAKNAKEIKNKIRDFEDRIYELEIEANHLRRNFVEKITAQRQPRSRGR